MNVNARLLRTVFPLALLFAAPSVRAEDKAACLDATAKGQSLRDAHRLLEAREQFRLCAQASCPAVLRHDCAAWLNELEPVIPTIVLSMKDGAGADVLDARVTLDGRALVDTLTGTAITVDPGPHSFRFERRDGAAVEQQVLVGEGQKNVAVVARLPAPPVAPAPRPVASSSTLRTAGWVLGGVGVAGLVTGGVFGALAVADKASGGCNASNRCTNWGAISSAKTAADVADAGLIAGGVLAATGAVFVLVGRSPSDAPSAWVHAAPAVARSSAGFVLQGGW